MTQDAADVATVEIGGQTMTQAQFDAARFPLIKAPYVREEWLPADVVASADAPSVYMRRSDGRWAYEHGILEDHALARPLTLLVRDGKAV